MGIAQTLSALALGQLAGGAARAVGLTAGEKAADAVVGFLSNHFRDNSQRLARALRAANDRAWKALEVALAGDSFWERCSRLVASDEQLGFRAEVRGLLESAGFGNGVPFDARACLRELRSARKARRLDPSGADPEALARGAGGFGGFESTQPQLDAQWQALAPLAEELRAAGYCALAKLVAFRPAGAAAPLLATAVRYFFRRAVEEDAELARGLAFGQLGDLRDGQDAHFNALNRLLAEQGQKVEALLGELQAVAEATHAAVLDVQAEQQRLGDQGRDIYDAVITLQRKLDLMQREVRPADSLSIRTDAERKLVKELIARYRGLPEEQRQGRPALLNAIGKLEVAAGDFQAAGQDFAAVAAMVNDAQAQGEAHINAYRAALERRDWDAALKELVAAVKCDPKRFAPFPVGKYQPIRILGAGGFGVAFLCKHKYMDAKVVVKTLGDADSERDLDEIFTEAKLLSELAHPWIIRVSDCGYADPARKSRPFLVMDYFPGQTLEAYVKERGPLPVDEVLRLARLVAAALKAGHAKGILHRDVKPANLLVRKDDDGWKVKVIDFGLAQRARAKESTARSARTIAGASIAGTTDYAAPEQMGKLPGMSATPASDVYAFGKTCCYALFLTPSPLLKHWKSIPEPIANLLSACLAESPGERPKDFGAVLRALDDLEADPGSHQLRRYGDRSNIRYPKKASGNSAAVWAFGGLLVIALLGVVGFVFLGGKKPIPKDTGEQVRGPDAKVSAPGRDPKVKPKEEPEPKKEPAPKKGPATGKEPEPKKKQPEVGPPAKKEPENKKEPEPKKKPEPGPEPRKEPLVVPVARPSAERRELAAFETRDNVLLSRARDDAPWKRVLLTAPRVSSADALVCLPGYHGELRLDSGVRLGLWGNLPEFQELPVLEARLTLHVPPPGLDADFTLGAGRVFITTRKAKGPTRVRLRFKGEVWDLTLPDDQTEVAADLFGRFPPGVPFSREPGGALPQAVLMLGVLKGKVEIRPNDKKPLAAEDPSAVIWESKKGSVEGPNKEEAAALSGYFSHTPTGRKQLVREMEDGLSDFSKRLAAPRTIVRAELASALKDEQEKPSRRYLAVQFLQAIDDLRDLADALGDEAVFVRVAAINALRHWIGGAADRDQQLYQVLVKEKGYEEGQAVVVLQLLHSPAREDLDKPETFATLFDFLGHEKLAVRELALWHLSRLDPDGLRDALKKAKLEKFGPDMAAPPETRKPLVSAWKDSWKRRFIDKKKPEAKE